MMHLLRGLVQKSVWDLKRARYYIDREVEKRESE